MSIEVTTIETTGAVPAGIQDQIGALECRLENGWLLIEQRASSGAPTEELERYWLRLLHEYETLCAAPE